MKLTADRKALNDVLALATGVVNARHTNPLIQNVLFDASKDGLVLQATDLEVSVQLSVAGVDVAKKGRALLPAAKLSSVLKDIRAETVTIETEGNGVVLKTTRERINLQSPDPEGFPKFPALGKKDVLEVPAAALRHALSLTSKSIAADKGRYALNGVLLQPSESQIEFCGTDGRRLAFARILHPAKKLDYQVIIPRRGLDTLDRVLDRVAKGNPDATVKLDPRENELVVAAEGTIFSTALVDGQFPDFWSVIPKSHESELVCSREDLLNAVRVASHMTSADSTVIAFHIRKNQLELRSTASGTGKAELTVDVNYAGEEAKIGFDHRYLMEGLGLMTAQDIIFKFTNANMGAIFHEGKPEDFFFLVMPIEVD